MNHIPRPRHIPVASRETVDCPERTERTYRPWGRFEVRLTTTPPKYINGNPANTEIPHFRAAGLPETPGNTEYGLLVLLHKVISWWVVLMGDMRIFIPQLARYQYRQSRRERKRLVASIHRQQRPCSLSWASTFVVCCVLLLFFFQWGDINYISAPKWHAPTNPLFPWFSAILDHVCHHRP